MGELLAPGQETKEVFNTKGGNVSGVEALESAGDEVPSDRTRPFNQFRYRIIRGEMCRISDSNEP